MKSQSGWKLILSTILTLAACSAYAAEPAPIAVNSLELKNVTKSLNHSVSVFYAVGSAPTFSTGSGIPFIRMISGGPIQADVHADGSASIPAGQAIRKGFQIFNYLVFVVHSSNVPATSICNANGSISSATGLSSEKCSADYLGSIKTIYRAVTLDSSMTSISLIASPITSTIVTAGRPVVLDLGAP